MGRCQTAMGPLEALAFYSCGGLFSPKPAL